MGRIDSDARQLTGCGLAGGDDHTRWFGVGVCHGGSDAVADKEEGEEEETWQRCAGHGHGAASDAE